MLNNEIGFSTSSKEKKTEEGGEKNQQANIKRDRQRKKKSLLHS